jgi:hypothetical protein
VGHSEGIMRPLMLALGATPLVGVPALIGLGLVLLLAQVSCDIEKHDFLRQLRQYIPADDYVMVGNILGVSGASDDRGAAERAGWRFIQEREFANGVR